MSLPFLSYFIQLLTFLFCLINLLFLSHLVLVSLVFWFFIDCQLLLIRLTQLDHSFCLTNKKNKVFGSITKTLKLDEFFLLSVTSLTFLLCLIYLLFLSHLVLVYLVFWFFIHCQLLPINLTQFDHLFHLTNKKKKAFGSVTKTLKLNEFFLLPLPFLTYFIQLFTFLFCLINLLFLSHLVLVSLFFWFFIYCQLLSVRLIQLDHSFRLKNKKKKVFGSITKTFKLNDFFSFISQFMQLLTFIFCLKCLLFCLL